MDGKRMNDKSECGAEQKESMEMKILQFLSNERWAFDRPRIEKSTEAVPVAPSNKIAPDRDHSPSSSSRVDFFFYPSQSAD